MSPVLRVLEPARVLLHEDPDPERVQRLVRTFRRDGVLRNPPIVASVSPGGGPLESPPGSDPVVVLDGANRVSALREIGAHYVVAQVVDYQASEISVSTWTHYVIEEGEPLRERIEAHLGTGIVAVGGPADAVRRLQQGDGLAALLDGAGAAVIGPEMDPVVNTGSLGVLVGLYAGERQVYRIDGWDLDGLRREYGPGTVVMFPSFGKRDILKLTTGGARLPAGITRHLIPGRVLRLNVPLAWLCGPQPTAVVQSLLDEAVEARWRVHGVRYYAEATYLFDE
jgi:hypothetical protein